MGHGEIQGLRNTEETEHGDVALALLNITDIRCGEACPGGECALRQVSLLAVLTDGGPKEGEQYRLVVGLQGGRRVRRCHRILTASGWQKIGCGG